MLGEDNQFPDERLLILQNIDIIEKVAHKEPIQEWLTTGKRSLSIKAKKAAEGVATTKSCPHQRRELARAILWLVWGLAVDWDNLTLLRFNQHMDNVR